jgi:hypothetical protein
LTGLQKPDADSAALAADNVLLVFTPKNSLTAWGNSLKYRFLCGELEFLYEELYGEKRAVRA